MQLGVAMHGQAGAAPLLSLPAERTHRHRRQCRPGPQWPPAADCFRMTLRLGDSAGKRRDAALEMLRQLCPAAELTVSAAGIVALVRRSFCSEADAESHGCHCVCAAIAAPRTIAVHVRDDLSPFGGGRTDDDEPDDTTNGVGSDEIVNVEQRNRWRVRNPATGAWADEPDWIILGHELCGHAVPGANGTHPEWRPGKKAYDPDWHVQAFEREDELRESFGLPRLGEHAPSLKA